MEQLSHNCCIKKILFFAASQITLNVAQRNNMRQLSTLLGHVEFPLEREKKELNSRKKLQETLLILE